MTARCSTCAINYPYGITPCKVCGGKTDVFNNVDPDPDWRDRVDRALGKKWELDTYAASGLVAETAWHEFTMPVPPSLEVFDYAIQTHNDRELHDIHPVEMAKRWQELTRYE